MCDSVVFGDSFMIVYWTNKYKTQRMCDEAVDNCLAALKFVSDWFVSSKMLEKFDNTLHAKDDILFYNEDLDKVTFIANQRHVLVVVLQNDNNFYEDDPDNIIHIKLLAGCSKFGKRKALKKG